MTNTILKSKPAKITVICISQDEEVEDQSESFFDSDQLAIYIAPVKPDLQARRRGNANASNKVAQEFNAMG